MAADTEAHPDGGEGPAPGLLRRALHGINIGHLLLIIFALHLFALSFPSDTSNGGGLVFDESYYVTASLDLIHGVANNLEHPFFGKIWGVLGISLFGNNFFGWRIFYAVVGTLAVWMMYELARQFFSKEKALLAGSMLAFENLFFVHTSLLLLDGPPVLFALAGFLAYFKGRYYLSALAFGLCILSKESGVFFLLALVLYHFWANSKRLRTPGSPIGFRKVLAFAIIISLVVGVPLWGYDYAYHPYTKTTVVVEPIVTVNQAANVTVTTTTTTTVQSVPVTNPVQNFEFYFTYQSSLTGCGSINQWNCYPWSWVLPFDVGPLPYYVSSVTVSTTEANGMVLHAAYHPIDWQGIGNLVVWYSIWLVVPLVAWRVIKRRAKEVDALAGCIIAGTYLPLFYISLVSGRVEYAFYFINTDVGLALGIPVVVGFLARGNARAERLLIALWLVAAVAFFFAYFPVNPFAFRS
ncbi:MAG TPA: glycosyltransferase family 39 protein [Nitrososphaerales archaeon]|nr:glycosyltransferase family 39 protein [Nitrososphaerales archaeon]